MARPARIDLRLFQQELATRLASKTTAQVQSSRLREMLGLGPLLLPPAAPPIEHLANK